MKNVTKLSLTLLSATVITACGGSGGGGNSSTTTPITTSPTPNITQSTQANNAPQTSTQTVEVQNTGSTANSDRSANNNAVENTAKAMTETAQPNIEPKTNPVTENVQIPPKTEVVELDPKSDKAIFEKIGNTGGVWDSSNWVKLNLSGNEIELAPVDGVTSRPENQTIHTLRNSDGELLGYYGYATVSKVTPDPNRPDENNAEYRHLALKAVDDSQMIQPSVDMQYLGKMYYALNQVQAQALEADVQAHYSSEKKQIIIDIYGIKEHLGTDYTSLPTNVDSDGIIVTKLYSMSNTKEKTGEFIGGLYGKRGEVLLGKAYNEDSNNSQKAWTGVVGATENKPVQ